jgi:putative transposase
MPRSYTNAIAETNPPYAAEKLRPARTGSSKARMGLEAYGRRIEERLSRLAQRGYLPHFDAPGVTQFITFQLHDAFPVTRRAELEAVLKEADDSTKRRKVEAWLDRGRGECWLRRREVAEIVGQVLLGADGQDYRMQAWVVMPNHVHLVVEVRDVPLTKLIHGWKGKSSREVNKALNRAGSFWQEDYYDTVIRDEAHLKRAIRYTEQNPVKAFLTKDARKWPWSSARLRDEYERLPWQRVV